MARHRLLSICSALWVGRPCTRGMSVSVLQFGKARTSAVRASAASTLHLRLGVEAPLPVPRRALGGRAGAARVEVDGTDRGEETHDGGLKQRFVYVRTSAGRWEDVPDGILFDVAYFDSKPGAEFHYACPTVLALHSTPGSPRDLLPALRPLASLGYRVLAPSFPGFGETEGVDTGSNDVFMHSTDEKAEFIRDFLFTLGIKRVDCVVAVGAASYPALRLCTTLDLAASFPALVLIAPWPIARFRAMEPEWYHSLVTYLWDRPFFRPFTRLLVQAGKRMRGQGHISTESAVTVSYTLSNIDFNEVGGHAMAVEAMDVPPVVVLAEDDAMLEKSHAQQLLETMHPRSTPTLRIHADGSSSGSAPGRPMPTCLVFEKGGSGGQLMTTHAKTIANLLVTFVQRVRKSGSRLS